MNKVKLAVATALVGVSLATASVASAATVVGVEYNRGSADGVAVTKVEPSIYQSVGDNVGLTAKLETDGLVTKNNVWVGARFSHTSNLFHFGVETNLNTPSKDFASVGAYASWELPVAKNTSVVVSPRVRYHHYFGPVSSVVDVNGTEILGQVGVQQKLGKNLAVNASYRLEHYSGSVSALGYTVSASITTHGFGVGLKYSF